MMNFKNIFGILAISAVSMMTVSCSEDIMDRINKDEAHPGESVVSAKFQLTDAIVSSVFTTNTGNFAWYVASYTEQILGTGNNQLKNAELRSINETAAASTFDNEWNGTYLNLNNIQQMIAKCEEGGNSAGQLDIKAMGQILAAYDWGIMTDLFGNIPCSEAFKVSAPKLDSQEDIYKHILELLDAAKGNLDQAIACNMKNAGAYDVLFNGNLTQWRGLAHALKARYLLHSHVYCGCPGTWHFPAKKSVCKNLVRCRNRGSRIVPLMYDGKRIFYSKGRSFINALCAGIFNAYFSNRLFFPESGRSENVVHTIFYLWNPVWCRNAFDGTSANV